MTGGPRTARAAGWTGPAAGTSRRPSWPGWSGRRRGGVDGGRRVGSRNPDLAERLDGDVGCAVAGRGPGGDLLADVEGAASLELLGVDDAPATTVDPVHDPVAGGDRTDLDRRPA